MKNQRTQQFAKFFLKDLKTKKNKYDEDNLDFDQFSFFSSK